MATHSLLASSLAFAPATSSLAVNAAAAGLTINPGLLNPGLTLDPGLVTKPGVLQPASQPLAHVSPGDLISADLLNALIDRINALSGAGQGISNLAGDVDGPAGANRVGALQGRAVADSAPAEGQVLTFANGLWRPATPAAPTNTAQAPAMRLVAAGKVSSNRGQIDRPFDASYQASSNLGNLRLKDGNGSSDLTLIFDGYDNRQTWVVHTSQQRIASGRRDESPQIVARVDAPVDSRSPTTQQPGVGLKVYGHDTSATLPSRVIQEQVLQGEIWVEIYAPPLLLLHFLPVDTMILNPAFTATLQPEPAPAAPTAPVASQPGLILTQPAVTQPVLTQPILTQPIVAQPTLTSQPAAVLAAQPGLVAAQPTLTAQPILAAGVTPLSSGVGVTALATGGLPRQMPAAKPKRATSKAASKATSAAKKPTPRRKG